MAEKVVELAKENSKVIFYSGDAHLVTVPEIVKSKADFKQIIIHQVALYQIDGNYYIDQLLDELLKKIGLEYLIFKMDTDEYFVANSIPEDTERLSRKDFDYLLNLGINNSKDEALKKELDKMLDRFNSKNIPIRKILKLYRELSLHLNPDETKCLNGIRERIKHSDNKKR